MTRGKLFVIGANTTLHKIWFRYLLCRKTYCTCILLYVCNVYFVHFLTAFFFLISFFFLCLNDSLYSSSPETGSDSFQTDLDDECSSVVKPYRVRSKPNNCGHRIPVYEEHTPIYVIKNLVVNAVRSAAFVEFNLFLFLPDFHIMTIL